MDGYEILIRSALKAFGVTIDPKEIQQTIEQAKVLIPAIAQKFNELSTSIAELSAKIDTQNTEIYNLKRALVEVKENG